MNKILWVVLFSVFLAGCGSNQSESKFQGVTEKKDYLALGMQYLKKSDIPRAIQNFDQAIKQDPKNLNNYMVLGEVYMKLREYARAVDTFSGAVIVDPNSGDAYYFLAISKRLKANVEKNAKSVEESKQEAIKAAQRSIEIFMQARDEQKFKRSVALLKSLESDEIQHVQQALPPSISPGK